MCSTFHHQESALAVVHSSPKVLAKTPQRNVMFTSDMFPSLPALAKTPVFKSKFAQNLCRDGQQKRNGTVSTSKQKDDELDAIQPLPKTPSMTPVTHKPKTPPLHRNLPSMTLTNPLTQCHRCHGFGHRKDVCRREFVCMKCAGSHPTTACSKPRSTAALCCNCRGQHIGAYRGCPVYKGIKRMLYGSQYSAKSPFHRPVSSQSSQRIRPNANYESQQQRRLQGSNNNNYWHILQESSCRRATSQSRPKVVEQPTPHQNSQRQRQDRRRVSKPNPFRSSYQANGSRKSARNAKRANPAERHLSQFQARLKLEQGLKDAAQTRNFQDFNHYGRRQLGRRQHNEGQHQQKLDPQSVADLIWLHKNTHTKLEHLEGLFNKLLQTLGKVVAMLEITDVTFKNSAAASGSPLSVEMQSLLGHDSFIDAITGNESIYV